MVGPEDPLAALAAEAEGCRACELWARATRTVFGAGPAGARIVLVGEQPGDAEDRAGAPFVGPAGRVLDDALADAHIERRQVYVTNAVKHFKWEPRGKRRIHQRPNRTEIVACRRWLEAELDLLPSDAVVVALGATAGQALFGPSFRVGAARGQTLHLDGRAAVATIHPSAVLRADAEEREERYRGLVADLARAARLAPTGR
jgi:DNA polymerase